VPYLKEAHLEVSLTKHAIGQAWPLYYMFILSTTCKQRLIKPVAFKELWTSIWPDLTYDMPHTKCVLLSLCNCCRRSRWPRDRKGRCAAAQNRKGFAPIFVINFTALHAPLLCSNITCIEVNFCILSSTVYLFHLQFWFLIYLVIFTHWTLSNNMLFANSLKFL
jgi:hypothetical protein